MMRVEASARKRRRIRLVHQALDKDVGSLLVYLRDEKAKREPHLLLSRVACLQALIVRTEHMNHLPYPARRRAVRKLYSI